MKEEITEPTEEGDNKHSLILVCHKHRRRRIIFLYDFVLFGADSEYLRQRYVPKAASLLDRPVTHGEVERFKRV